jgi:hypothetical protein
VKASSQRSQTIVLKWIRGSIGNCSDICVEVINSADTYIGNVMETDSLKNDLVVPLEEELLFTNLHVNLERGGPSWCIELLDVVSRHDCYGAGRCQQCDNEHGILHVLPAVGTSFEVVSTAIIRWNHGSICGVAIQSPEVGSVPVDKLIRSDIAVWTGGAIVVRSDEWLSHIQPTIMRPNEY